MESKKILILSLAYYPKHVGGAEVAIKEITDRIRPQDIEFHMVTLRFDSTLPKVEKIGNVLVHRIGFSKEDPNAQDMTKFPLHLNKFIFQFSAYFHAKKLQKIHNHIQVVTIPMVCQIDLKQPSMLWHHHGTFVLIFV